MNLGNGQQVKVNNKVMCKIKLRQTCGRMCVCGGRGDYWKGRGGVE